MHNLRSAECIYSFDNQSKTVIINPFYPKFIDSFMHEVGHLQRWDKIYKKCIYMYNKHPRIVLDPTRNFNFHTNCILKEEYVAWKFSKRFLKARFDRKRAKDLYKTYFPSAVREWGITKATNLYYGYDKNI